MGQTKKKMIETCLFPFLVTYHMAEIRAILYLSTYLRFRRTHVWQRSCKACECGSLPFVFFSLNRCYIYYFRVTRYQVYEFPKGRRSIKFVLVCPIPWAVSLVIFRRASVGEVWRKQSSYIDDRSLDGKKANDFLGAGFVLHSLSNQCHVLGLPHVSPKEKGDQILCILCSCPFLLCHTYKELPKLAH